MKWGLTLARITVPKPKGSGTAPRGRMARRCHLDLAGQLGPACCSTLTTRRLSSRLRVLPSRRRKRKNDPPILRDGLGTRSAEFNIRGEGGKYFLLKSGQPRFEPSLVTVTRCLPSTKINNSNKNRLKQTTTEWKRFGLTY